MARQLTESESILVREMEARIRELEGDLSNAQHDLQAVHALHERLRQAEAERDEALILLERLEKPNQMMRWMERIGLYDRRKLDMDAPVYESAEAMIEAAKEMER